MRFEFATSQRMLFGAGTLAEAAPAARSFGRRALVVVGKSAARAEKLLAQLQAVQVAASLFQVPDEPTIEMAGSGTAQARAQGCDLVIALGGGSPLDAGKAIAALLANPGDIYDYLEIVGKGQPLANAPLPFIAIPTTSGTGSEATRNAVLTDTAQRIKVSLRSPLMLPRLAIVDPELTCGLPQAVTAASGMDALTQLLEPFLSNAANPLADGFCREGLPRAARALLRASTTEDPQAREDMALASLLGGMALANARLGAVHAFAGPIGGLHGAPHGALCARLLPLVMQANLKALQARQPQSAAVSHPGPFYRSCALADRQAAGARGRRHSMVEGVGDSARYPPAKRLWHYKSGFRGHRHACAKSEQHERQPGGADESRVGGNTGESSMKKF